MGFGLATPWLKNDTAVLSKAKFIVYIVRSQTKPENSPKGPKTGKKTQNGGE